MMISFYQTLILPFPRAMFSPSSNQGSFLGWNLENRNWNLELLLTSLGEGALWVSLSLCLHLCIMGKISNRETNPSAWQGKVVLVFVIKQFTEGSKYFVMILRQIYMLKDLGWEKGTKLWIKTQQVMKWSKLQKGGWKPVTWIIHKLNISSATMNNLFMVNAFNFYRCLKAIKSFNLQGKLFHYYFFLQKRMSRCIRDKPGSPQLISDRSGTISMKSSQCLLSAYSGSSTVAVVWHVSDPPNSATNQVILLSSLYCRLEN